MNRMVSDCHRRLHQIPELSEQEFETTELLADMLKEAGFSPTRVGKTGVYADIVVDERLPWILLRADIDALPIMEKMGLEYASTHSGVMHACGHDAHSAMLLTAAASFKNMPLPQNVRLLFQPAEETTTGAAAMIAHGVVPENCAATFAMHVWPDVPKGCLAARPGAMMASSDVFHILFHGKSVHCSRREQGADALQAAVETAHSLPEIETLANNDGTVLFCGSIHSGHSHNIVPAEAELSGTLRTYSEETRKAIIDRLSETVSRIGAEKDVGVELQWVGGCPAVNNSGELVDELKALFPKIMFDVKPVLAAEDFALYQRDVPGVMLWLGLGDWHPLHSDGFYVPDEILEVGVKTWRVIAEHDWKQKGEQNHGKKKRLGKVETADSGCC